MIDLFPQELLVSPNGQINVLKNTMPADALAPKVARASAGMVLASKDGIFSVSIIRRVNTYWIFINTLKLENNDYFADNIFKYIFSNENV